MLLHMHLIRTRIVCIECLILANCKPRSKMARFHVSAVAVVLCILTLGLGASRSASQKEGFRSINCGGGAFTDSKTTLKWEEDPFNENSSEPLHGQASKVHSSIKNITIAMTTLRYFPSDRKNRKFCYSLPVSNGSTYFLRASFLYGNYDGLSKPPTFLLIFNYNEWEVVTTSLSSTPVVKELTFNSTEDNLNICIAPLLNQNSTPFISTIELRLLNSTMYSQGGISKGYGLMLWRRINYGARTQAAIRYPDDPYDRIWEANTTGPTLRKNTSNVDINEELDPENPAAEVMATAITSKDPKGNLSFTYEGYGPGVQGFRMEMHFEELQEITGSPRNFTFAFPNSLSLEEPENYFVPNTSSKIILLDRQLLEIALNFQLTLVPSPASLRAPLLNAIELFHWTPQPLSPITMTSPNDVEIIKKFQTYFKLLGNGQGDPCMPEGYAWTWIACNENIPLKRITEINLASFNLTGDIPPFINNMTSLKKIDLSNNKLSGVIPNVSGLLDLVSLDLSNNKLSGVIPNVSGLLDLESLDVHSNNLTGELPPSLISLPKLAKLDVSYNYLCGSPPSFPPLINYTYNGNKRLCNKCNCTSSNCDCTSSSILSSFPKRSNHTRKYIVPIFSIGALYIVSTLALLIIFKARKKEKKEKATSTKLVDKEGVGDLEGLPFITKMFTYKEISDSTLNFTTILGEGGFGKVYRGLLPTGEAIAVKMLADASKQGLKEFYNEVAILSRVCHKNLVSLIGYCVENTYMLIYEYIEKGNLRDLIYGEMESTEKPLPWTTRLQIALDASQGLDYLHTGCDPAIIHRDVKSNNILLSEKMEAKVADFGLSRLKDGGDTKSHVSTINVMGTAGYLDPAYNATYQLTDKSDVYSFGIVLLELICGRAPIDMFRIPSHIVDWASQSIVQGKVEEIVDPMLANGYKMDSMQKAVDLAFGCVENDRTKRPKMSEVSQRLQNALEIEMDTNNYSQDVSGSSSTSTAKTTRS